MAIVLDGKSLTIEKLVAVARHREPVELAPESLDKIKACRAVIEEKIKAHEIMYGINTGIGEFSEVVLDDEQVKQFQRYLIYNHAAGIGGPAPIEHVRAAMAGRINVHAKGRSGCRPEITQTFVAMLNSGVTPVSSCSCELSCRCVVEAGWMISDFASPILATRLNSFTASISLRPAS